MSNEREKYILALANLVNGAELGYEDRSSIPQYKKDIEDYVDSLEKVNKEYKEVIYRTIYFINNNGEKQYNHHDNYRGKWYSPDELDTILDILKEVE